MKKVTKILLLLLVATLICAGAGLYAFSATANSSITGKAADSSYAFKVFKPSTANGTTGSTNKYTANSLSTLKNALNSGIDGTVITLLSDVTITTDKDAALNVSGVKYIDLNGYSITFIAKPSVQSATGYGFMLNPNSTLYVYSSDASYTAQIRTYVDGTVYVANGSTPMDDYKNHVMPIFNMRYDNSTLYFGTIDNAPVSNSAGTAVSRRAVSGDNIVTYANALFSSLKASYKANPVGSKAYIRGGTHYQTAIGHERVGGDGSSFITSYTGVDIILEDATFISTVSSGLISTCVRLATSTVDNTTNYIAPADGNITANRCKFYSEGTIIAQAYESVHTDNTYPGGIKLSSIEFNNCYFAGTALSNDASNGSPDFNNCYFASAATIPGSSNKTVSTNKSYTFNVPTATYTYAADGSVTFSLSAAKSVPANFFVKTATEGNYATITWNGYGKTEVTYWDNDRSVVPTPAFVPESSGLYKYQYTTTIKAVTGDATYNLEPTINFPFMTNLTLYAHFVYNVYIPKDIADSPEFISVFLDGKAQELKNVVTVSGEKYYVLSHELPASVADQSFDLTMRIEGYEETFDYTKALSIPDYVSAVTNGNYSAEAKALVSSADTYIKAARNYYTDSSLYAVPELEKIVGKPASQIPAALSDTLYGVTLELGGTIKFRLFIYKNAPDFTFSYQINNVRKEFSSSEVTMTEIPDSDLCYFDISVSAFDLRDTVRIISSDGTVYYYSLANYIYSVQGESSHLTTLMDAIWEYSVCSEEYASVFNSQSPTIQVTISGSEIDAIVATNAAEMKAAEIIQNALAEVTGITVPITSTATSGANVIVTVTAPVAAYDAKAYVKSGDLYIECGYASFTYSAASQFVNNYIIRLGSSYNFATRFTTSFYTDEIYYSDFGAVGDGVTDDFFAMKAAHDMANATKRHTVRADSGKTYLIEDTRDPSGKVHQISITSNVNWGNANIIIKDTNFSAFDGTGVTGRNIFVVAPDKSAIKINDQETIARILAAGLGPDTTKIDLGIGKSAMLIPYNTSHKVYRRIGYGKYEGHDMHEIILIDEEGNVSSETPVVFNYSSLDYILVYDIDETPITVEGGIITTLASHVDIVQRDENGNVIGAYNSFINRGLKVMRSNTTVKNVQHYVEGEITLAEQEEGILGAPYHGFFCTESVHNVTFDSCVLTGRRCYSKSYLPGAGSGATGSYDYTVDASNKVIFKNCTQSNFWIKPIYDSNRQIIDVVPAQEGEEGARLSMTRMQYKPGSHINFKRYWGLGGSNHSKNMSFIDSRMSRFDSHSGLYNAYIINSDVNGISLTGGGEMIIENSRWFANADGGADSFVDLRGDYGSTWNGTLTLKDSTAYVVPNYSFSIIGTSYSNWDFGYTGCFPNLVIDNITILDINGNSIIDSNGNPLSKYVSSTSAGNNIFDMNGKIRLIAAESGQNVLDREPNVHLSETQNTAPIFAYVDEDGDGYVDDIFEVCGIKVPYDKKIGFVPDETLYPNVQLAADNTGLQVTTSNYNLNPITPPESIVIKNDKYSYYIPFTKNGASSTFFDNTYVSINGTTVNGTTPESPKVPEYVAPDAADGLVYNGSAQQLLSPGTVNGGTMMYKIAGGIYSTEIPTATNAGTYVVFYKIVGDDGYTDVDEASITVIIEKAIPTVTPPTVKTDLMYNASMQELVIPGVAEGCTVLYRIGNSGEFSNNIPTATEVGTYVVYYKIVGGTNYHDAEGGSITVTISVIPEEYFEPTETPVVSAK